MRVVKVTADGAVSTKRGRLHGVVGYGAGAWSVLLYDNPSAASGTEVGYVSGNGVITKSEWFKSGVDFATGLYADVTSPTAIYIYIED